MSVACIGPHGRGDGDHVVAEVVEDVNVLPVVEDVGSVRRGPLYEPRTGRREGKQGGGGPGVWSQTHGETITV